MTKPIYKRKKKNEVTPQFRWDLYMTFAFDLGFDPEINQNKEKYWRKYGTEFLNNWNAREPEAIEGFRWDLYEQRKQYKPWALIEFGEPKK